MLVEPEPPVRVILLEHLEAGPFGQPVEFRAHKVVDVAQSLASVPPIEQEIRRVDFVRIQSGLRPGDDPTAQPGPVQKVPYREGKPTGGRQQPPDFTQDRQPQFFRWQVMQYRESQHPLEGAGGGSYPPWPARIGEVGSEELIGRRPQCCRPLIQ